MSLFDPLCVILDQENVPFLTRLCAQKPPRSGPQIPGKPEKSGNSITDFMQGDGSRVKKLLISHLETVKTEYVKPNKEVVRK